MVEENIKKKQFIKAEANRLGFSHIGFTTPHSPDQFPVFDEWVKNGHAAEMGYLSRVDTMAKRETPQLLMPGCQTIISLALPYFPSKPQSLVAGQALVAAYAVGVDYHLIIPQKSTQLMEAYKLQFMQSDIEYKIFTDSAPVLERYFAQKAGIGWIGKNTNLIIAGFGSYFFLAEIFISDFLEPDVPLVHDYCGNCNRCIEACPTDCILPNRTLDASKCISYITIESKSDIPSDIQEKLNGWAFGCDICQQVCPWNIRFGQHETIPEFNPIGSLPILDISHEIQLNPNSFQEKYKNSPILRAKFSGFLRNLNAVWREIS
jgi:epoxyqueuosine reductase